MLRKLLVNALAVLAVLAVAGGAMAAASSDDAPKKERPAATAADDEERPAKQRHGDDDADSDDADDAEDTAALESEEGTEEADSFGAVRSAEVAAYHECRKAAADEAAEDACEKPGPAWANDAHPVFGADGEKAGQKPGDREDPRTEASAQRPERAAKGKAHGKPSR